MRLMTYFFIIYVHTQISTTTWTFSSPYLLQQSLSVVRNSQLGSVRLKVFPEVDLISNPAVFLSLDNWFSCSMKKSVKD